MTVSSARAACAALLVLSLTRTASAEPKAAEKETARALMNEGRARRDHHDLKRALESFLAADAIMHVPTTGFEVARTQAALGQLVEARDTLRAVLRIPARPDEPRPFTDARASAQQLDDDLAGRIPTVRLELHGAPEGSAPSVELDGATIPPAAAAAPLKVDPGHHAIVVTAGTATGRVELDVDERAVRVIQVQLTAQPAASAGEPPPAPLAEGTPADEQAPTPSRTMRTLAYGGFGVAAAGAAVGAVTGMMSLSKTSSVKRSCDGNACPASVSADLDSARTLATTSNIAFAVAGAGLGVAIVALLVGDKEAPPSTAARVTPWIGAGAAGLRGAF